MKKYVQIPKCYLHWYSYELYNNMTNELSISLRQKKIHFFFFIKIKKNNKNKTLHNNHMSIINLIIRGKSYMCTQAKTKCLVTYYKLAHTLYWVQIEDGTWYLLNKFSPNKKI